MEYSARSIKNPQRTIYNSQTNAKPKTTNKPYDLEDRTVLFAKDVIVFCKALPQNAITIRLISQIVASSGSVGANYREATEALSKRDFLHRMKITRKECKETTFWLELLGEAVSSCKDKAAELIQESKELRNIFTAIIEKAK